VLLFPGAAARGAAADGPCHGAGRAGARSVMVGVRARRRRARGVQAKEREVPRVLAGAVRVCAHGGQVRRHHRALCRHRLRGQRQHAARLAAGALELLWGPHASSAARAPCTAHVGVRPSLGIVVRPGPCRKPAGARRGRAEAAARAAQVRSLPVVGRAMEARARDNVPSARRRAWGRARCPAPMGQRAAGTAPCALPGACLLRTGRGRARRRRSAARQGRGSGGQGV